MGPRWPLQIHHNFREPEFGLAGALPAWLIARLPSTEMTRLRQSRAETLEYITCLDSEIVPNLNSSIYSKGGMRPQILVKQKSEGAAPFLSLIINLQQ